MFSWDQHWLSAVYVVTGFQRLMLVFIVFISSKQLQLLWVRFSTGIFVVPAPCINKNKYTYGEATVTVLIKERGVYSCNDQICICQTSNFVHLNLLPFGRQDPSSSSSYPLACACFCHIVLTPI